MEPAALSCSKPAFQDRFAYFAEFAPLAYGEFPQAPLATPGGPAVEVAKRLGKANSYISKCELGERRVDFVELQQLARVYKKDLAFFR